MPQQHYFEICNDTFHYIDWGGSGPLAHIAHATGLNAQTYTPLAERLSSHLRVLGMDDRGHGQTRAAADPVHLTNWDIFVTDLEHFLARQSAPVVAMGHSRGGVVSLLLALKRPDLIRALILIDPTILPPSWTWFWLLAKKIGIARFIPIAARAAKRKSDWPDRATLLSVYRKKGMFRSWQDGFLSGYIQDGTAQTDTGTLRLTCTPAWESKCFAACPHDTWRSISQIQQPTLVLYGAESDTFLAPAVKRFQAEVPHAQLQCFQKTGHFVPMEEPDETCQAITTFLKNHHLLA